MYRARSRAELLSSGSTVNHRVLALLAALGCACFSDPPPVEESGSTGAGCSVGANMCPCTDGGACDAGLQCHGPLQLCYDPGCTPGTDGCTCDGDECSEGLRCNEGLCETREDPTASGPTSAADSTAGDPSTSGADSTTLASEVDSGTDTDLVDPCRTCLAGQATACAPQYAACSMSFECMTLSMCIMGGTDAGACCNVSEADADWDMFVDCALEACGDECSSYVVKCG